MSRDILIRFSQRKVTCLAGGDHYGGDVFEQRAGSRAEGPAAGGLRPALYHQPPCARIIVEMQASYQRHVVERALYYATFAITEQAPRGDWNFRFDRIYSIVINGF